MGIVFNSVMNDWELTGEILKRDYLKDIFGLKHNKSDLEFTTVI